MENVWIIKGKEYDDRDLVRAILADNNSVVNYFFFDKCKPLFLDIQKRFYTGCEDWRELASEFYLYLIFEGDDKTTPGHCNSKLAKFGFNCRITHWMKLVLLNYCKQAYKKKPCVDENFDTSSDRNDIVDESLSSTMNKMYTMDTMTLLNALRPERYGILLRCLYIDSMTMEETADVLGVKMGNLYNMHARAKESFKKLLFKEGLL